MPPKKKAKTSVPEILKFYRQNVDDGAAAAALEASLTAADVQLVALKQEHCYNVQLKESAPPLTNEERDRLVWLLAETFEPENVGPTSKLPSKGVVLEVGPRLSFATAFSSNAVSICASCGLASIERVELSRRFHVQTSPALKLPALAAEHAKVIHDQMTECVYEKPLDSFASADAAAPVTHIPLMSGGRKALEKASEEMGLGFDEDDLDLYTKLFTESLGRDPTDVECFDMGQSNSEHSRHWFFGGVIEIDGVAKPKSLFQMVKATLKQPKVNANSVIAFHDNSSAIEGGKVTCMYGSSPSAPAPFATKTEVRHPILTAETHNFPCGIAPFPGAETGTGGRIRDVQATGRGAFVVAGVSAYCMGRLRIPGYHLPWEDDDDGDEMPNPPNLASPLHIQTAASNGASDYGNKFGEPVITGFNRSFGLRLPNGERREWLKPIMFSAGLGQMPGCLAKKGTPEPDMWVVKVGGPAYRIGLGGGAASSKAGGEDSSGPSASDFNAVQRGDAEMENRMNRVIRACAELGEANPIVSIHDQGAGGNGNVLKELVEPLGAKLQVRSILSGDPTLSVLELWGAEYQENCGLLVKPESLELFKGICARENCPASFVGQVTGDGRVVLEDSNDGSSPVDLPLSLVLAELPKKTFKSGRTAPVLKPLTVPNGTTVASALDRVLRLPSVGSKRFLTNKVDRSVTGLIAQQQCVGPFHTPLADCGVIALSHSETIGAATAVGEQPIKGLVSPAAMARLTVAEALTNLAFAPVSALGDVKCSANWMWAAKLPGEAASMWDACEAMVELMSPLGVAVDGGKDSLSMAAKAGGETVKAPGALVVTLYATCTDVRQTVTPDLKGSADDASRTKLYLLDCGGGRRRLGGSALAQCYKQIGDTTPDVDDPDVLRRAFDAVQSLVKSGSLLAGHDVSDGGLLTCVLEMGFAGDVAFDVDLPAAPASDAPATGPYPVGSSLATLAAAFAEEVGLVVEVADGAAEAKLRSTMEVAKVPCVLLGATRLPLEPRRVMVSIGGAPALDASLADLRDVWEATSFELEKRQCAPTCVAQEQTNLSKRYAPQWHLSYTPKAPLLKSPSNPPNVAVIRQEGSNGDREMGAALMAGGLAPWDVAMSDLVSGAITLDKFRGVIFVGGFSYADVLGSAKGWAAVLKFNAPLWAQLKAFRARKDTFSLGVCNGCQLMALLGWVPTASAAELLPPLEQPRFIHNGSGRFESRFSAVTIQKSPAVLLQGMEGSTLGVWVAHGEGKAHFPAPKVLETILAKDLAPIRYADDANQPTEAYPFNPNGSPHGIAGLCSEDGRHLAMMPHPERCFLTWQQPWMPAGWKDSLEAGPWIKLFQNAAAFCNGA